MTMLVLLSWMGLIVSVSSEPVTPAAPDPPPDTYGGATVSMIHRIDAGCTLYCDLEDFPPIIGKNMPVKIRGLKTADAVEYNQKIQAFLAGLLLEETDDPPAVNLNNIRRGRTFCFVADITIEGEDLCDLLVENGLAQRIIEVREPASADNTQSANESFTASTAPMPGASVTIGSFTFRIGGKPKAPADSPVKPAIPKRARRLRDCNDW